jgi:hypothetical protein
MIDDAITRRAPACAASIDADRPDAVDDALFKRRVPFFVDTSR